LKVVSWRLGFVALAATIAAFPALADEIEDFYRGHPVTIVVGHEAGTGFDLYARVLARHLGRHLPGLPTVGVQNMQGATGLTAAGWLYNSAPRDGSVIGTFAYTVPLDPLFGSGQARFEPRKFNWLANLEDGAPVCGVSPGAGISTFDDLLTREVVFGGSGAGASGPLVQSANAVRSLTGARIKLVQGYRGSHDLKLALERGEIFGVCGLSYATIRSEWRDLLEKRQFKTILQLAPKQHPDLVGVPRIYDRAKTDEERRVFDLVFGSQTLGRLFVAPPEIPAAKITVLRKAVLETVADDAFLADAKTAGLDLAVSDGATVEKMIDGFYVASAAVVARAKQAVRGE
jgi:tripartite-type tricarboxylate transporter receptor subunit TctC